MVNWIPTMNMINLRKCVDGSSLWFSWLLNKLYAQKLAIEKSKVILIEDEPAIADTVVYALQSEGYSVDWRNTGESGIALVKTQSPDIVILDIGLPDMNGFEVFQKIRSISTIPVIF